MHWFYSIIITKNIILFVEATGHSCLFPFGDKYIVKTSCTSIHKINADHIKEIVCLTYMKAVLYLPKCARAHYTVANTGVLIV